MKQPSPILEEIIQNGGLKWCSFRVKIPEVNHMIHERLIEVDKKGSHIVGITIREGLTETQITLHALDEKFTKHKSEVINALIPI